MIRSRFLLSVSLSILLTFICFPSFSDAASSGKKKSLRVSDNSIESLQNLDYRLLPQRTKDEAAVLEWGHSAIISALDASVAHFGPQTSHAALLEVEAMPILAQPINGVRPIKKKMKKSIKKVKKIVKQMVPVKKTKVVVDENGEESEVEYEEEEEMDVEVEEDVEEEEEEEEEEESIIRPLDNADEIHGNVAVMTNAGNELSGVQMAMIAQESGAAALLVVNLDEEHPEDIYRLPADEEGLADEIQIPVAMISLNSANALTSATVTPEMKQEEIVNNGMPDRVRIYAGGDRPFFEDVEAADPTVYLIHNLLTDNECDDLIKQAQGKTRPVTKNDPLQLTHDASKFHNVERVMLWMGLLHGHASKAIEERIEQVTGFPTSHFSDFIVDKMEAGAYWLPHVDINPNNPPLATITVFLSEDPEGGELIFPSTMSDDPIMVQSVKGLAVVHHNTDENRKLDVSSVHAMLPVSDKGSPYYVARKFIFETPVSNARRTAVPAFAFPFGGRLPDPFVSLHDLLVQQFGSEQGGLYFDKACIFFPALVALCIAQVVFEYVRKHLQGPEQTQQQPSSTKDKKKNN